MKIWRVIKKAVTLQRKTGHVPVVFKFEKDDSLAQLVEHNTFNVGVVGSSPTRITNKISQIANIQQFGLFLSLKLSSYYKIGGNLSDGIILTRVRDNTSKNE